MDIAQIFCVLLALVISSPVAHADMTRSSWQCRTPPCLSWAQTVHLAYELGMTNFSSAEIAVEKVEVMSEGAAIETLDTAVVAVRLQPAGQRDSTGTLAKGTQALLFLNCPAASRRAGHAT